LCGHVEADELGAPEWDWKNFYPGGTVNAKVADSQMAERMSLWGSVGHPCGGNFKLEPFLKAHPEYAWQREIAGDMPSGAWTQFSISTRKLGEEIGIKPGIQQNKTDYEDAARRRRDPGEAQPPSRPGQPRPPQ
jgi:hypothetical protein